MNLESTGSDEAHAMSWSHCGVRKQPILKESSVCVESTIDPTTSIDPTVASECAVIQPKINHSVKGEVMYQLPHYAHQYHAKVDLQRQRRNEESSSTSAIKIGHIGSIVIPIAKVSNLNKTARILKDDKRHQEISAETKIEDKKNMHCDSLQFGENQTNLHFQQISCGSKRAHPDKSIVDFNDAGINQDRYIEISIPTPKVRLDQTVPLDSPSKLRRGNGDDTHIRHVSFFPFGKIRTLIPVLFSVAAFTASVCCEKSSKYVSLEIPLEFDARYEPVVYMGLFHMEVCRAEEMISTNIASETITITKMHFADDRDVDEDPIDEEISSMFKEDYSSANLSSTGTKKVCKRVNLSSSVIDDSLWNAARLFVGLTTWLGFLMTFFVILGCFWGTMNWSPIGVGLFSTYIFQSFAFFFFDTDLCKEHGCKQSVGGNLAVMSVICWFGSAIGVLGIILNERSKRRHMDLLAKKVIIAGRIYEQKKRSRVKSFMKSQMSFMYLFSNNGETQNGTSNISETESSSSSSDEECVDGRVEV